MTEFDYAATAAMQDALVDLQTVKTFDMPGAYYAVFGGSGASNSRDEFGHGRLYGKCLAIDLWWNRMTATHDA